ncbi:hypothetical protein HYPGJ_10612 [Hyphomicrobium sp. GJ21]|nr:hypothetical protein HYPGJ_10612 [Hyphomicrobium sp. GJ21]
MPRRPLPEPAPEGKRLGQTSGVRAHVRETRAVSRYFQPCSPSHIFGSVRGTNPIEDYEISAFRAGTQDMSGRQRLREQMPNSGAR